MSFIAKNPLTAPAISSTPTPPPVGTRGMFAGEDGWYDIDAKGNVKKIGDNDITLKSLQYYGDANIVPSDANLFEFITDDNTMTATVIRPSDREYVTIEGDIVIPYEYHDVVKDKVYKVTGLELNYYYASGSWFLPNTLKKIYYLIDCSLKEIVIPDRVEEISIDAFSSNFELHTITFPSSLRSIGKDAFISTPIDTIYFKGTKAQWESIDIGEGNDVLASATIYYEWTDVTKEYVKEQIDKNEKSLMYYEDATIIPSDANLFTFTTDDATMTAALIGVAKHNEWGEPDISGEVVIPYECVKDGKVYKVTSIGERAFYNCAGINKVIIPNTVANIANGAFYYCGAISSMAIPDGVISIENDTFCYCSFLANITIPSSVTSIGNSAFYNCELENIYFKDTKENWENIQIEEGNEPLSNATIYYNYLPATKWYVDNKVEGVKPVIIQNGDAETIDIVDFCNNTEMYYGVIYVALSVRPEAFVEGGNLALYFSTPDSIPTNYSAFPEKYIFKGDSTEDNKFVPEANTRYTIVFSYDGANVVCYVSGVKV